MGVVVPSMSRSKNAGRAPFVESQRALLYSCLRHCCLRRDIARPPADRLVVSIHTAAGVVRGPAGNILKQTDRANAAITAQVEPVQRAARNTNQIASLNLERDYGTIRRMNVEESTPGDDVTHFVFIVAMLDVELREHGIESRGIGIYIDDVGGHVSATAFQFLHLWRIGVQDLLRRCFGTDVVGKWPALVFDPDAG